MKRAGFLVAVLLVLGMLAPSACTKSDSDFGLYLADSGEQVLGLEDIQAYHSLDSSLELTPQGIEKWNSFQTSTDIPKLAQSLYQRDFIIKIDGNELCRGKFYSMVSSASYNGIVIMDSIVKLDSTHNSLRIEFGYVQTVPAAEKDRIATALDSYFDGKGMRVEDKGYWFGQE